MKINIIVPYYNESLNIQRTLDSIFAQSNFSKLVSKVVLFNDFSDDLSVTNVFNGLNSFNRKFSDFDPEWSWKLDDSDFLDASEKFTTIDRTEFCLINSPKNLNSAEIYVKCLEYCEDDAVIVWLDGGDWLCDIDAIRIISDTYDKSGCDILWTNHRFDYTGYNISKSLPANANVYEHAWVTSALRTFKKSLYNKISHENLKDKNGNWIRWARDQALYLPMLHIAEKRMYLPIVAYHYAWYDDGRIDRTSNEYKLNKETEQKETESFIRRRGYIETTKSS